MKKMLKACALVTAVAAGFTLLCGSSASAENRAHAAPQFSCGVSVSDKGSSVTVTKTSGVTDPTKDVVAIITTPDGKKDAVMCGKGLVSDGSHETASFNTTPKSGYLYLCTASQTATASACNPVR